MPSATARIYSGDFPLRRWILTRGMFARAIVAALLVLSGAAALGGASLPEITLPVHDGTLRIAVVGDAGLQTDIISHAIAAAKPFDAIVLVGDNFYPCGVK